MRHDGDGSFGERAGDGGLRLDGVGRRYGLRGPWVLRDVALAAEPGAVVRVEGPNGSGKSTLLRIVAGVDRPTAGRVTGRPAGGTAYVPERFPPALPFPVLRYLTHMGAVRGLSAPEARTRALGWLERFGITGYAGTPLDELSKGTCQKVAVAQALLADPLLLVLDEAWTGLDTRARAVLDGAVRDRAAAGATVFFVDHDPQRLAYDATAVLRVDPGQAPELAVSRATVATQKAVADAGTAAAGPGSAPGPADEGPVTASAAGTPAPGDAVPAEVTADAGQPLAGSTGSVVIEAVGEGELPAAAAESGLDREGGVVRGAVPAGQSDAVLRALLEARPPWHITSVRTAAPRTPSPPAAPAAARRSATTVSGPAVRARRSGAVLRYQLDLLLRSHRWLPPLIFYGAVMAIGIAGGEPLLGSLGYAAALLLPVAAWTVRVCVTGEPAAARACVAAAVGPARVQRAALAAAAAASGVLGLAGTAVVAAVSGRHADDLHTAVPVGPAAVAGAMAAAVSVLLGTAVGALTNPPLVRGGGWPILVTAIAAGAVLIVSGSPAQAAVTGLVTGSRTGTVHYPLPALLVAAAAAFAATRLSAWAATRLTP
ncbi:ATP-binding cassette domain-containing protein [Streptomyces sp. NPDC020917]|uniref:ABC transporter ATP-binding protein n=1 Tax=Streptomyces sp. NPDC020917 TaxID=3365102 RepID=UPI0037A4084F